MEYSVVYVTCENQAQAQAIAAALLEQELVACANILPEMCSMYRWEGAIQQTQECVLLLKTAAACVDVVIEAVQRLHSYECPCVIAFPITKGAEDFLKWLAISCKVPY